MIGSGIKRGTSEFAVRNVLENGALHGWEIARRIEQQTKGSLRFTLAALYPMLYRLETETDSRRLGLAKHARPGQILRFRV